jgi:hypothetical protein
MYVDFHKYLESPTRELLTQANQMHTKVPDRRGVLEIERRFGGADLSETLQVFSDEELRTTLCVSEYLFAPNPFLLVIV